MKNSKAENVIYPALGAIITAICSMITVPGVVPFTMQSFAVFFVLFLFGGVKGSISIVVYVVLGMVGLPVFSGFRGGISAVLGADGGYIIGFVFIGLIYLIFTVLFGEKRFIRIIACSLGLLICYCLGTFWFVYVYAKMNGEIGIRSALTICVLPFIIPDAIKMAMAFFLSERIKPHLHNLK